MTEGRDAMADVSHVHPETSETFWDVYRRGPAVADGGRDRARRNGTGDADATERERSRRAPGDGATMADVSHEPPYPEANDVWTRGFERPSDAGSRV